MPTSQYLVEASLSRPLPPPRPSHVLADPGLWSPPLTLPLSCASDLPRSSLSRPSVRTEPGPRPSCLARQDARRCRGQGDVLCKLYIDPATWTKNRAVEPVRALGSDRPRMPASSSQLRGFGRTYNLSEAIARPLTGETRARLLGSCEG